MSVDSAKAYVERMKTDEKFRKKVLDCKDAKKRMELIKSGGYDFIEKEIKDVTAGIDESEISQIFGGVKQEVPGSDYHSFCGGGSSLSARCNTGGGPGG